MKIEEAAKKLRMLANDLDDCQTEPMTYGEILERVKELVGRGAGSMYVHFDFGCAWPNGFSSYRGKYAQLGFEYSGEHHNHERLSDLFLCMKDSLGTLVEGWKGGEVPVKEECEVYVACAGCTSDTRVTAITWDGGDLSPVIIRTTQIAE